MLDESWLIWVEDDVGMLHAANLFQIVQEKVDERGEVQESWNIQWLGVEVEYERGIRSAILLFCRRWTSQARICGR